VQKQTELTSKLNDDLTMALLPCAITYKDGPQRIYAFVASFPDPDPSNLTGSLYINYWDGFAWHWASQGKPPGTAITRYAPPSVITYRDGPQRIYAFVAGTNGHLYVNYWNGAQWNWADQGTPPGTTLSLDLAGGAAPSAVTFSAAGLQRTYVFVVGNDGHLYVNYWNGAQWNWADQGTPPGTTLATFAAPAAVSFLDSGVQRMYVFVRGGDQHLHINYWDGAQWRWADQGQPSGRWLAFPISAVSFSEAGHQRVYAFMDTYVYGDPNPNGDQNWINYWDGSAWHWAQQSSNPGVFPSVVTYPDGNTTRIYAFVMRKDAHLWVNYWDGAQWHWADQGYAPTSLGVGDNTSAITYRDNVQRIYVFINGVDASSGVYHLYANYWDGSQWRWADQGVPSSPAPPPPPPPPPPPALPDLAFSGPASFDAGSSSFLIPYANIGGSATGPFSVRAFLDSNEILTTQFSSLGAGGTATCTVQIFSVNTGEHLIYVVLDVFNQVNDPNRSNNVKSIYFSVSEDGVVSILTP